MRRQLASAPAEGVEASSRQRHDPVGPAQVGGKRYFRYFTDWNIQSFGGFLVVGVDQGERVVLRAWSQAYWSRLIGWITEIEDNRDPAKRTLELLGRRTARIGFVGYDHLETHARVIGLLVNQQLVDRVDPGMKAEMVLDETPFYAESGGQIGDKGEVVKGDSLARVETTTKLMKVSLHQIKVEKDAETTPPLKELGRQTRREYAGHTDLSPGWWVYNDS